ncbi:MAG TPA: DUF4082 domain-containing protein, partial [Reyranella sp.]|nr:DUF4082 domain-containing protein [Reyranella sp.]
MSMKQAKNSIVEDRADNEAIPEALTFSAFSDATPDSSALHNDMATVELGMRFAVDRSGSVTELKYWRGSGDANDTDVREGYLWRADGTLLATVTFTSDPGQTGWQVATLSSPVPLTAGVQYIVAYRTDDNYVSTPNYFVDANDVAFDGLDNDSFWGPDGVVRVVQDGAGGTNGVFRYDSSAAVMPSDSWSGSNYWVDITFDTGIAPSNSGPVITSAAAVESRENRRTVGAITAIDANGDPLSYTITGGADAAPFTIDAKTGGLRFTNTPSFEAPADAGADNVYDLTVSVSDGIAPAVTQAITVAVTDRDESDPNSSVFDSTDVPAATDTTDSTDYELGMRFTANAAGTITELRYFRGAVDANDTDTRVLTLWDAAGTRLGSVTVTSAAGESGWQVGTLSAPIAIQAGATYVVSYGTTQNYAYTADYFTTALTGPDGVLSTGADSGVFAVTPGAFPTQSYHSLNYWVDVDFVRNRAPVGVDDADATLAEADIGGAGTASASGNVLANDTDADVPLGDVLTVTGARAGTKAAAGALTGVSGSTVIAGTYGRLTIGANGAWSYALDNNDPDTQGLLAGQQATETFTYAVADSQGQSDTAQLVLTITGDADPLIVAADKGYVSRGFTIPAAALLANDGGDGTLAIQSIANATGGTVAADGSGNP